MYARRYNEGWTLLEIMIVVTIIGMMALIAIPTWTAAKNKSVYEVCRRNQNLIFEQMNIYCLERNLPCDVSQFPNLCTVRDALVPLGGGAKYIKRRNVFSCPQNPDKEYNHDYRFVREADRIVDIECDYFEEHNVDK